MDFLRRRPRAKSLLVLPLFCLLSACTSLGSLVPQFLQDPPPAKTTTSPAPQGTPAHRSANASGARSSREPSPDASLRGAQSGYLHVVRWQGETFSLIAQWYTGSWKNWRVLANLNGAIKPDRLAIGDRVLIPEGLLKNRKPLPRDLVFSLAAKERVQQPASTFKLGEDEPLDLFGPKD
jgi:hypothetical protein